MKGRPSVYGFRVLGSSVWSETFRRNLGSGLRGDFREESVKGLCGCYQGFRWDVACVISSFTKYLSL